MLIDHIIGLADELGVPHADAHCEFNRSRACVILERLEALFLLDYSYNECPPLGERFHIVLEKVLV